VSENFDGRYEIAARVAVGVAPEELMRWLTGPELMARWILGVESVESAGDGVRVTTSAGVYAGWTFLGETVERSPSRLVRRYRLERMRAGVITGATGEGEYERTVAYELTPGGAADCRLECSVSTAIPGLARAPAKAGAKAEQRALDRSLERLRNCAEGGGVGLLVRWRTSGQQAGPL
jgi:carbon monoxide dehydrogenase subunit G